MQDIPNVLKIQHGKQRHGENLDGQLGYSCDVCGGERYHLVLTAEALNNRIGLKIRCGTCNASLNVIDGA